MAKMLQKGILVFSKNIFNNGSSVSKHLVFCLFLHTYLKLILHELSLQATIFVAWTFCFTYGHPLHREGINAKSVKKLIIFSSLSKISIHALKLTNKGCMAVGNSFEKNCIHIPKLG